MASAESKLSRKARVDRALLGKDVDRSPFSFRHHFGLDTPEAHAKVTLDFQNKYRPDIVKVMSDFPRILHTHSYFRKKKFPTISPSIPDE